ncbi:MAG: hypothetical protein ABJQ23_20830 [Shimia thalassica]|uniref:hypothetical protein n=1 Tax=Shimia thalassica TaxID=1715693 RepID=UPI00329A698C
MSDTELKKTTTVYVLGSTRSGTSAIRNGLSQTRYMGYGEGHLAPILQDMIKAVRYHKAHGVGASVEGNGLYKLKTNVLLRYLFDGYERYLANEFKSANLLDKTPTIAPILLAPDLNTFHQRPKFVYCSRRHIDNIQSKMKKFPDRNIHQHCIEWAECNKAWLTVREQLNGNFLEFDFFDLVSDTKSISTQVGNYLDLDEEEVVSFQVYLDQKRPEAATGRDLTKFLKLSSVDWTDSEKESFVNICGPVGDRLGYGMEEYFD